MRRKIGYAKLGRSLPLRLENCGSLGGDIEAVPTLKLLAERRPDVDFVLVGRNSGELPSEVGLPNNVLNPWREWGPAVRSDLNTYGLSYPNLTIPDHVRVAEILHAHTRSTFDELDGMIMWLGQHGTTNTPLPKIEDRSRLTKPYDWATLYASYLLRGVDVFRDADPLSREEVLLNSDVRNYVKYRDCMWPRRHPVLAQYNQVNTVKHERYGDDTFFSEWVAAGVVDAELSASTRHEVWQSKLVSLYSRIEISALMPGTPFADTVRFSDDYDRPHNFGMVVNETRREVNPARARRTVLQDWVLPLHAAGQVGFIHGKWSQRSLDELDVDIQPVSQLEYIPKLQTARCTLTTPASGSGWATAKPWESFAAGVICFFHPAYDDQNNILGDAPTELQQFLRVSTPGELRDRLKVVATSETTWRYFVTLQREHLHEALAEARYLHLIERRLGL